MFVAVLILSVFMLWSNLKSYKKLFVPDKYLNQETREKFTKVGGTEDNKGIVIVLTLIIAMLPVSFYSIAANVFIDNKILLGYAVLMVAITLVNIGKVINFAVNDKDVNRGIIGRIITPLNTIFIGYFIYYYTMSL